MIGKLGNNIYTKIFWGIMGIYLLNISVDTIDSTPIYLPENLAINDQESIAEIIIEKILGFENAIEEYDDCDSENQSNKTSKVKIEFLNQLFYLSKIPELITDINKYTIYNNSKPNPGYYKLLNPPPEV